MHKAALDRHQHSLGAVLDQELIENPADVNPDGILGNMETISDLPVAAALRQQVQYLGLSVSEFIVKNTRCQSGTYNLWKISLAVRHSKNRLDELFATCIFGEIRHRTSLQGAMNILAALVITEN